MVAARQVASHWFDRIKILQLLRPVTKDDTYTGIPAGDLRRGDRFEFGGNLHLVSEVRRLDHLVKVRSECAGQPFDVKYLPFEQVTVVLPRPQVP